MQHIIEEIRENFQVFIGDEEKSVLLVEAEAEEGLLLLKTLSLLEDDEFSPDIFASHTDGFSDARSYVSSLFENQSLQLESVNELLAEKGEPLLEEFPAELASRTILNHDRLLGIAAHVRKIVQPERKIIWVFFALGDIEHEEAYAGLLRHLAFQVFDGKLENTKLIIRDTPTNSLRKIFAANEESVSHYQPKLDTDSIFKKIEAQSKNADAPPDERAQSMMMMAGVDVAEKRFDRAIQRNKSVLDYFEKSRQTQKQSVVHNNIGDIYYLQGDFPLAQEHYGKALEISIAEKAQPLVIYQSINFGNALFMQANYDDALIYYDSSAKLAAINKALPQQIQALERLGDARKAKGELEKAIAIWNEAAELCRESGYKLGLYGILKRLDPAYEEAGEIDKRIENWRELEEVKSEVEQVEPALLEK